MALHVLDAELIQAIGMLDTDEEGRYTVPHDSVDDTVYPDGVRILSEWCSVKNN